MTTCDPAGALRPAAGRCRRTWSFWLSSVAGRSTLRTVKPASISVRRAASSSWPTTFGTVTSGRVPGPTETLIRTSECAVVREPPGGCCETTTPRGRLDRAGYESTRNPARSRRATACRCARPTTLGTVGRAATSEGLVALPCEGPVETLIPMGDPFGAGVPDCGACATTMPLVSDEGTRETLTRKPRRRIVALAFASVSPSTAGTLEGRGPCETLSRTVDPLFASPPVAGACFTTRPFGCTSPNVRGVAALAELRHGGSRPQADDVGHMARRGRGPVITGDEIRSPEPADDEREQKHEPRPQEGPPGRRGSVGLHHCAASKHRASDPSSP